MITCILLAIAFLAMIFVFVEAAYVWAAEKEDELDL